MSLRHKIPLLLLAVVLLFAGLLVGTQKMLIPPAFDALERDQAIADFQDALHALQLSQMHLQALSREWAESDFARAFVSGAVGPSGPPPFVRDTYLRAGLDLIYVCDREGRAHWSNAFDLTRREYYQLSAFPAEGLPADHPLLRFPGPDRSVRGLMRTERGPLLVASTPVRVARNGREVIDGAVIMGQILRAELVAFAGRRSGVDLQVWRVGDPRIPAEDRAALAQVEQTGTPTLIDLDAERLHAYATLPDLRGDPVVHVRGDIRRDISLRGQSVFRTALLSGLVAGLLFLGALILLLRRSVTTPLSRLTRHVSRIGSTGDLQHRLVLSRGDEIGTLALEFDRMVAKLESTRGKVSEQAYELGQAEMAAGVLHNTRNALAPLLTRLDQLVRAHRELPLRNLEEAERKLSNADLSLERRKEVLTYVDLGHRRLREVQRLNGQALEDLWDRMELVVRILDQHAEPERSTRAAERLRLPELLAHAQAMIPESLLAGISIDVAPDVRTAPEIEAPALTVQQILANLLTNAAESIRRAGRCPGKIEVEAGVEDDGEGRLLHVRIRDDGSGIAEHDLERIFQRGVSSKSRGGTGIGLHWSANAARALRGSLTAHSEGRDRGAVFHLRLPVARALPVSRRRTTAEASA